MADLAAAGFPFRSVSELRTSGTRYRGAVPILLDWLGRVHDDRSFEEELVRALSVPWAKPAATGPLIEKFRGLDVSVDPTRLELGWVVGNALYVLFDDSVFDAVVELAQDRRYGRAREMVVLGLGRSKRPEMVDILIRLTDDPDVYGHAIKALGKLKAPAARPALEAKVDDERTWVRRAARKALEKLPD